MDMNTADIPPQVLQQTYLDFKKVVDKHFSPEAFAEGVFDSTDMANAIEEMATASEKFGRLCKEKQDENSRSSTDGI